MTDAPARAVIYVCMTQYGDVHRVIEELRQYAAGQSWTIVGEFADRRGLAANDGERPQFHMAKAAIAAGHARIMLTRYPSMLTLFSGESPGFAKWAEQYGAEVRCSWRPVSVPS